MIKEMPTQTRQHAVLNSSFKFPEPLLLNHYGHMELNLKKSMGVIMTKPTNEPFLHFFLALNYNAILVDPKYSVCYICSKCGSLKVHKSVAGQS